ncbi:g_PROTEIN_RECEP_F1_2 domain-containing protein [Caerostris extrusa]|uniref:G_PROTEIN_RECEP_F1_2 domain-containing protein n=1 Tax=Caerostris extrusa TaxID=172846 RepID=A0AAV4TEU7_CAEEX|nr:g_PROTEIN_RECEP_F1_2 domain-containing protein [Caerostris extrusa]
MKLRFGLYEVPREVWYIAIWLDVTRTKTSTTTKKRNCQADENGSPFHQLVSDICYCPFGSGSGPMDFVCVSHLPPSLENGGPVLARHHIPGAHFGYLHILFRTGQPSWWPVSSLPCTVGQFGLVAVRTFQVATLASMVVDRALTVRWPYRYRFSVRRNQIRYHVSVLALVSILVGVAGVFARLKPNTNICSLHPSQWDVRYVLFLLCLYAFLILASLICMVQVEVHRVRHGTKESGSFQLPECVSPDLPTGMNSPLDTQSSTGSTRALHRPSRQASRRPYAKNNKGTSDLRWPSVALTCLLCFLINHIPYLVSTFHFDYQM